MNKQGVDGSAGTVARCGGLARVVCIIQSVFFVGVDPPQYPPQYGSFLNI